MVIDERHRMNSAQAISTSVQQSPSMTAVELPVPRDWQVFEDFCRDLFAAEWGDPEAKLHGRSGQRQHGVDVYGRRDGEWMAVQCKRRGIFPEKHLGKTEIRDEVAQSRKFGSPLACLVIATTAPPDTGFDQLERELTDEHGFRVVIYGWAALVAMLQNHDGVFDRWRRNLTGGPTHPIHLPFRPLKDLFKGREAELAQLEKGFADGTDTAPTGAYAVTQRLEAVHGLGGVGKTALARWSMGGGARSGTPGCSSCGRSRRSCCAPAWRSWRPCWGWLGTTTKMCLSRGSSNG